MMAAVATIRPFQMLVLCIINFNEAVQGNIIWPFIPFLVQKFGAPEKSVGSYVGVLASSFFFAQLLFVTSWGRLADRIGRRPVLLWGTVGTTISMAMFGFSTSYRLAVLSRFLTGALNANIAIAKVYVGEITSGSTQARAFSWLSFTWGLGTVSAPAIGGWLADPAAQYPGSYLASVPLLQQFPYLLPALISSSFSALALILGYLFLPETDAWLRKRDSGGTNMPKQAEAGDSSAVRAVAVAASSPPPDAGQEEEQEHLPMLQTSGPAASATSTKATAVREHAQTSCWRKRCCCFWRQAGRQGGALGETGGRDATTLALLTDEGVGLSILNYTLLSLAQIVFDELQPVFCKTDPAQGGLGWSSADVGSLQVVQGAVQIVFQLFLFHRLADAYSLTVLFKYAMLPLVLLLAVWPALGRLSGVQGPTIVVVPVSAGGGQGDPLATSVFSLHISPLWAVLSVGIGLKAAFMTVAFTSIMIMINNSARGVNLGVITGIAQGAASAVRTLGPTAGGAMYSVAVSSESLGSPTARLHLVYACIGLVALVCFGTSYLIPQHCNSPEEEQEGRTAGKGAAKTTVHVTSHE